jgi:hypothetical protein
VKTFQLAARPSVFSWTWHLSGATADASCTVASRLLARSIAITVIVLLSIMPGSGGAACNPRPGSASRWKLQKHDGVSWLVDPCGEHFFSIGVNSLTDILWPPPTLRWDRERHAWLPPDRAPDAWASRTVARIRAWGFNTAGSFSPPNLPLPSLPDLDLGWRAHLLWTDPFDPAVENRITVRTREAVNQFKDSYRIGYFSDNEVGWWNGALFSYYLRRPGTSYTKQALIALIRHHYGDDWHRFTADFVVGSGIVSFRELLQSADARANLRAGGNGIKLIREWSFAVTRRYYELVHRALRKADPAALIFGDRLPSYYDPDAVRAMAPFVDAIATNYDVDTPDGWIAHYYFDGLRQLTGNKPVLISEWYFAAQENRSGNLNIGHLMTVRTQAERARGAASAARHFALVPGIVGLHWFEYYDEPRGGRAGDHENYNFGLLDTAGRPYEDLVTALTATNRSLADLHQSASRRTPVKKITRIQIPEADVDARSLSLAQWPKDEALVQGLSARAPEVAFGDLFLAWSPQGLHLATISMDHYDAHLLAYDGVFPRTEAFRIDFGVDAGAGARRFAFFVIPPKVPEKKSVGAMRVEVCRVNHETCEAVPSAIAIYQTSDRPRVTFQVTLPWEVLGISGPPENGRLRVQLAATAFYRSRWMSLSGEPPAQAMVNLATWKPAILAGRPGASSATN